MEYTNREDQNMGLYGTWMLMLYRFSEFKTFPRQGYVLLLTNLTHAFVICIFQFYVIRPEIASITEVIEVINISLKTR
jgi:hypothetical protein